MSSFGVGNIVNKANGKQFIFKSKNMVKKIENTRNQLNFGCHYNMELQKDWDKFGPNNFSFNILVSNLDNPHELNLKFVECLNDVDYVYNIPVKDLIKPLKCDIEILTEKLYDLIGNEVNTESFNKKLKEYELSNQDGITFKSNFINLINNGLVNHSNFDEQYENSFKEFADNKLLNSLYTTLNELNFDDKIEIYELSEDVKLKIIEELKTKISKKEITNQKEISKNVDLLIKDEYQKSLDKNKAYEKLYELTGEKKLNRDFKYLLKNKGLSEKTGLKIRNNLKKLIEKGEVTEFNVADVFKILIDEEFEKSRAEIHNEKQVLIDFLNDMDFEGVLNEHCLHINVQYKIKDEITLLINQNKIKTFDDIEFKSFRMIKDLEIDDVKDRLNNLDKRFVDRIMAKHNLKSGFLKTKKSKISDIIKSVPVNIIKEDLEEYTGKLTPIFCPNPNEKYCPQCGALNDGLSQYCDQCGSKIK